MRDCNDGEAESPRIDCQEKSVVLAVSQRKTNLAVEIKALDDQIADITQRMIGRERNADK